MSTPTQEQIEQAKRWYVNTYDLHYAPKELAEGDRQHIADLAAYHAHASRSYGMSREEVPAGWPPELHYIDNAIALINQGKGVARNGEVLDRAIALLKKLKSTDREKLPFLAEATHEEIEQRIQAVYNTCRVKGDNSPLEKTDVVFAMRDLVHVLQERYRVDRPSSESRQWISVEKDRDNLRRFIEELVSSQAWGSEIRFPDDMDGGSIQDLAEKMGILKAVDHPEPCSIPNCPCIENGPFDFLYHFVWDLPTPPTDGE